MKVTWSPSGRVQLLASMAFIAKDDPAAAARWVDSVGEAVARLVDFPLAGRLVPEIANPDVREILVGDYRIVYEVGDVVEVAAVRHGSLPLALADIRSARGSVQGIDTDVLRDDDPP